jgi:thiol-disulfide isomerase/thioredoxin
MRSALLVVALLCWIGLAPMANAKRAPNLDFKDRSGKTRHVADLRGSIVVLNFWATWCGPCQEELPLLSRLNAEFSPRGIRFIAASADEEKKRGAVDKFVAAHDVQMEVWLGADLDMLQRAGLGNELPATLVLDEQGEIVARVLGEAREDDIRRPIEWLLGGKNGPAPPALVKHY